MAEYDYESVHNFIRVRQMELLDNEFREAEKETRQAVTVRLPRGHVALIDRVAKELDYSRQDFFSHLVDVALQDVIKTLADLGDESDRMAIWKDYHATMEGAEVTGNE
jgi:hypothetical protein